MSSTILDGLNDPQREAVETLQGPLLILAGAGSGKTRVVTRRIANLVAHGVRPWQILAITFTNKAAGEMRHRVEELLLGERTALNPSAQSSGVVLSTFHSFCARLLRREASELGFTRDFTIFDEGDATTLIKAIVKEVGVDGDKRFSPRNVRQMISGLKNQGVRPEDVEESSYDERLLKKMYEAYDAALKKNQGMDFDDLLRRSVELLRDKPNVLARYQDRYRYILVDEYQDTNACQYHMINLLGQKHHNVCATGDPDQSIYAWRGADVRNIMSFERDFPEAKIVKLEQNYRSTKLILRAADAVIANNEERKKKTLWTENDEGEKIVFDVVASEEHEAEDVGREIAKLVRSGRRYKDFSIFYRTNAQSRPFESALRNQFIPYQIIGGTAFYERREVKDALSYLRLIRNPKDDTAFERILNVPRRGLGDAVLESIKAQAAQRGVSLLETFDGSEGESFIETFKPRQRQGIVKLARLFDKLRSMAETPVMPIVRVALEESGLMAALITEGEVERIDNANELLNAASVYDEQTRVSALPNLPPPEPGAYDGMEEMALAPGLSGFLENSALQAATDAFDGEADHVTLMTLHMAKGLEFPVVFLSGLEEGLMPMIRSSNKMNGGEAWNDVQEDPKAVEEERRLMYVGITRAREKLYLSRAKFRRRFGKSEFSIPSRFLHEIPQELLASDEDEDHDTDWEGDQEKKAFIPQKFGRSRSPFNTKKGEFTDDDFSDGIDATPDDDPFKAFEREIDTFKETPPRKQKNPIFGDSDSAVVDDFDSSICQDEPPVFEIGDRVRHFKFGVGTVERLSGEGDSIKATVIFRNVGPKQLLLSLARLEKL